MVHWKVQWNDSGPSTSMEKFLSEFNIGDDVVVFNATDFFKWYDTTLKYMDDLKDELKDKKDIKK